jgi:enamine deaminase RidA (YjgF/YER057c/UK114 family)
MQTSEEVLRGKLKSLGIVLPPVPVPLANYVPFVIAGNLLFLSGQGPKAAQGGWLVGKVGKNVTADEAYQHARLTGIRMLSVIESALGSLDRVSRVVKVLGFVNSTPAFGGHPIVINGCSDLMVEVFGEIGRHARSAVGVSSLPEDITVEIEGIFEIRQT